MTSPMIVDGHDIEQLSKTVLAVRDDTLETLDDIFQYLIDRDDFSSIPALVSAGKQTCKVLEGIAGLLLWNDWRTIVQNALKANGDKGLETTMEDIQQKLVERLVEHTRDLAVIGKAGVSAQHFALLLNLQYAGAVRTVQELIKADVAVRGLCDSIALSRGESPEAVYQRFRESDEPTVKAVLDEALKVGIENSRNAAAEAKAASDALGLTGAVPAGVRDAVDALGLDGGGLRAVGNGTFVLDLSDDAVVPDSILQRRVPRYADSDGGIKVG